MNSSGEIETAPKRKAIVLSLVHAGAALIVLAVSSEAMARLDDWIYFRTPFFHSPDQDRDMKLSDGNTVRGRPHGRFRRFRLNAYGFRSSEMTPLPATNIKRILLLGASETYGVTETAGMQFPAQLERLIGNTRPFEIVNAAIPGMNLRTMLPYWTHWASQFCPHVVFIYPTPFFFLDIDPPKEPEKGPSLIENRHEPKTPPRLRMRERIVGVVRYSLPRQFTLWRQKRGIQQTVAGQPPSFVFETIPSDRLQLFEQALESLVKAIQATGAQPVLITHANRSKHPPTEDDLAYATRMRVVAPRAKEKVLLEFEDAAADVTRAIAKRRNIACIDLAQHINGRAEFFADLWHFNDTGASEVARTLFEWIIKNLAIDTSGTDHQNI